MKDDVIRLFLILVGCFMVLAILVLTATGCAKTSATMFDPVSGATFEVNTFTVWKDVKDAHLDKSAGRFKFDLGESSVNALSAEELAALACLRDRAKC